MIEGMKRTYVAGEDLAEKRRVKISGATVVYADAGEAGIGVNEFAVSSGENATIRHWSDGASFEVVAAGAFAAGATLYGAADGKVDDVAVGSPLYYANEAATANNDENARLKSERPIDLTREKADLEVSLEPYGVRFWSIERR